MKKLPDRRTKKKRSGLKRFLTVLFCVFAVLALIAFLPILLSQGKPCAYDDALLGTSQETIAASWTRVYHRENDKSIALESSRYGLWQRDDEQMVAVFEDGKVCDYLIRSRTDGSLRGSVEAGFSALSTWLQLRFGMKPANTHDYDVGSGDSIDSWLTSDGKVVVWFDSSETMVLDAFTMDHAAGFVPLTLLNTLVHLPYILWMLARYRLFA